MTFEVIKAFAIRGVRHSLGARLEQGKDLLPPDADILEALGRIQRVKPTAKSRASNTGGASGEKKSTHAENDQDQ